MSVTDGEPDPATADLEQDKLYCSTCSAAGDAPCKTASGYIATQPHSARAARGYTFEMQAAHYEKITGRSLSGKVPPPSTRGQTPAGSLEEISLALWYVKTMGSMERAKRALLSLEKALQQDAAAKALPAPGAPTPAEETKT